MIQTTRIVFHGRVQGVGFRWTTHGLARSMPICGYVCNLSDGTVEVVAKATDTTVRSLVNRLKAHFGDGITAIELQAIDPAEDFDDFQIRR
ncbi:MAG: acylphosphatase [Planctomycetaceae bacterium]|nr:acylphosphatase [Planctomycetaceae bacterium]